MNTMLLKWARVMLDPSLPKNWVPWSTVSAWQTTWFGVCGVFCRLPRRDAKTVSTTCIMQNVALIAIHTTSEKNTELVASTMASWFDGPVGWSSFAHQIGEFDRLCPLFFGKDVTKRQNQVIKMLKIPWDIVLDILDTVGAACYLIFPRSMGVSRANLHLSLVLPNFFPENKPKNTRKKIKTLKVVWVIVLDILDIICAMCYFGNHVRWSLFALNCTHEENQAFEAAFFWGENR